MRKSLQREFLQKALMTSTEHPTADRLYEMARLSFPNISLGTIYRNLNQMLENGQILSMETVNRRLHYDGNTSPHSHFICDCCGQITDLFGNIPLPTEIEEIGFAVNKAKCIYYGVCKTCKDGGALS